MIAMITDLKGNKIFKRHLKKWTVYYIYLTWEERARKLWVLKDSTFRLNRDRERHLFIKNNSYWFNDTLLRNILTPATPATTATPAIDFVNLRIWFSVSESARQNDMGIISNTASSINNSQKKNTIKYLFLKSN